MQIQLEKKLNKRVQDASKTFGVDQSQLVKQALLLYLDFVQKSFDLKKEIDAWDTLSDEVLNGMKI